MDITSWYDGICMIICLTYMNLKITKFNRTNLINIV